MSILKHVGKLGEKPCVVVFRELPGEPENCLVVPTGSLEDRHHDDLMNAIQTPEAQESNDVANVLDRKQFTDGEPMLNFLHYNKKLQKVPVSHVSLTPTPSTSIPLAEVNAEIRKIEGGYVPPKNDESHIEKSLEPKTKDVAENVEAGSEAQNLLVQAQLMKEDAAKLAEEAEAKLQQAYELDPTLKPKRKAGRPKKSAKA